jgi:hypothetical protein
VQDSRVVAGLMSRDRGFFIDDEDLSAWKT